MSVQGSFADETYISGTYLAADAGNFQALADPNVAATYKFTLTDEFGKHTLVMDDSNQAHRWTGVSAAR